MISGFRAPDISDNPHIRIIYLMLSRIKEFLTPFVEINCDKKHRFKRLLFEAPEALKIHAIEPEEALSPEKMCVCSESSQRAMGGHPFQKIFVHRSGPRSKIIIF